MRAVPIAEAEIVIGPPKYLRHPRALRRPTAPFSYQRRKPEENVLHGIVTRNLSACLRAAEERSEHGFGYPTFVEREFKKYLECGQLRQGFVRVKCASCPNEKLVAFSCKRRGFCTARRMSNTAAHLVDSVLPARAVFPLCVQLNVTTKTCDTPLASYLFAS